MRTKLICRNATGIILVMFGLSSCTISQPYIITENSTDGTISPTTPMATLVENTAEPQDLLTREPAPKSLPAGTPTPIAATEIILTEASSVITQCVDVIQTDISVTGKSNSIVLGNHNGSLEPFIYSFADKTRVPIQQNSPINSLTVSPDGDRVAYIGKISNGTAEYGLIIRMLGGEELSYPIDILDGAAPFYWLDNDRLLLVKRRPNAELDIPSVLNVVDGVVTILPPDFPGIISDDYVFRFWPSLTVYAPDLVSLVYLAESELAGDKLVLLNRETDTVIAEIPYIGYMLDPPRWSTSGNSFVFVKTPTWAPQDYRIDNFFSVDLEGQITQLTFFERIYKQAEIYSFQLSPDGKYIAFWLNNAIAVLDITTKQVTNFCLTTDGLPYLPVWSSDSRFLAIGLVDPMENSRTVILSLEQSQVFQIAEGVFPLGWMSNSD